MDQLQPEDLSEENAITCEKQQDTEREKPSCGPGEHQLEHTSSSDSIPRSRMPVIGQGPQMIDDILYEPYLSELQMPSIVQLMKASLSEPYSIYTYRYFIHKWPQLCKLAMYNGECVGAIVCKLEPHHFNIRRGYIAMLAVAKDFRRKKIGSRLVDLSIQQMAEDGCDEVVLETEVTNRPALSLYQNLGFVRDKYLHQYYLNGVDAYRLKLWLRDAFSDSL